MNKLIIKKERWGSMKDEKDICMFCDEEIEDGEKVECKKCKSVYHKTCFDELQHLCMKCGEDNDLNEKELKKAIRMKILQM